mmetsp:Transcript_36101/g.103705  ORF Transcript_36101/g.103705 Transcript_36101/m.103705 type:complete len:211 (+) Transcript_36101:678-1310(+)
MRRQPSAMAETMWTFYRVLSPPSPSQTLMQLRFVACPILWTLFCAAGPSASPCVAAPARHRALSTQHPHPSPSRYHHYQHHPPPTHQVPPRWQLHRPQWWNCGRISNIGRSVMSSRVRRWGLWQRSGGPSASPCCPRGLRTTAMATMRGRLLGSRAGGMARRRHRGRRVARAIRTGSMATVREMGRPRPTMAESDGCGGVVVEGRVLCRV